VYEIPLVDHADGGFAEFLSGHKRKPIDQAYEAVASMMAEDFVDWYGSFESYINPGGTMPKPNIQTIVIQLLPST
jgi:hypothetical protein